MEQLATLEAKILSLQIDVENIPDDIKHEVRKRILKCIQKEGLQEKVNTHWSTAPEIREIIGETAKLAAITFYSVHENIREESLELCLSQCMRNLRLFFENLGIKELAEAANIARSLLLANISHELRTPLNAIIGFSETMDLELFGLLPPEYKAYAADIHEAGHHLLSLVNDILDFSKLEAGHTIDILKKEIDLKELIDFCRRIVQTDLEKSQVHLEIQVQESLPPLYADKKRLRQILLNFLSNAIKFTPEKGTVSVLVYQEQHNIIIEVKDTGIGMDEAGIQIALTKFGQVESTLKRKHGGTGLGLPLAKKLLELHGGIFSIQSKLGEGTTVRCEFPLSQ